MRAPSIAAVAATAKHGLRKQVRDSIVLVEGFGVDGDAHGGTTVQHLYDKRKDPRRPNLRQVHLIEDGLIHELNAIGFLVSAGDLGENITTRNLDLLALAAGAVLRLGQEARIRITGLRAPCIKLDRLHKGLRHAVTLTGNGPAAMKRAVMAEVIRGGLVRTGDAIEMEASLKGSRGLLHPV